MVISINLSSIWIPTSLTAVALIVPFFMEEDRGWFYGISVLFWYIPALLFCLITWIIYAVFK